MTGFPLTMAFLVDMWKRNEEKGVMMLLLRPLLLFEVARDAELPCFSRSVHRHGRHFAELLHVPVFRPHNIGLLLLSTCDCSSLGVVRLPNVRH